MLLIYFTSPFHCRTVIMFFNRLEKKKIPSPKPFQTGRYQPINDRTKPSPCQPRPTTLAAQSEFGNPLSLPNPSPRSSPASSPVHTAADHSAAAHSHCPPITCRRRLLPRPASTSGATTSVFFLPSDGECVCSTPICKAIPVSIWCFGGFPHDLSR